MSIRISQTVVDNATNAIEAYQQTAEAHYQELLSVITTLQSEGFIGDASDGFKSFFDTKITPAITTNLIEGESSLMVALKKMITEIGEQFMDNLDPQLGEANENAGNSAQ